MFKLIDWFMGAQTDFIKPDVIIYTMAQEILNWKEISNFIRLFRISNMFKLQLY